ncbi:MAG TPA: bifunctional precorrin-2 dehydrogenase/sirohydrochlorin ferrochelatase [Thermomicrobiales bacterium]|nr:bifunctional precorrin-2 dehydrogenase/sirohydrochlorin ferrochelatase [Thermomicrobiales bacterium]
MAAPAPAAPPYPLALTLAGRRCVVVGGGAVAERKARGLLAVGAAVTVIAPRLAPGLRALADAGALTVAERPYAPGDLAGAVLAFAATDRREVNAAVAAEARASGALVNVADAPGEGDFTLPAVARRGGLTVAVATAGESPLVASLVRDRLAECLAGYDALLDVVAALRAEARATGRRYPPAVWRAALTPEVVALAAAGRADEAAARLRAALDESGGWAVRQSGRWR